MSETAKEKNDSHPPQDGGQDDWKDVNLGDPNAVLARALSLYHPDITLASSFSVEDVMLIDMITKLRPDAKVFALDTGRLNPETYECAEEIRTKYNLDIEWFFPKHDDVQDMENKKGLYSFRESILNRKECCYIRKVEPLNRALEGKKAWITGLRRGQSATRTELKVVEIDESHGGIIKVNPLANLNTKQVWDYVKQNKVPYNKLHDHGYPSIGCAPCTRAIKEGEDLRAGRWWWENPDDKECGLHLNVDQRAKG